MVRELLRAPVTLESIEVTSDWWTEGEVPHALSPAFNPAITEYEVTVPFETTEVYFRAIPRLRAVVRYAAADGSSAPDGRFAYTEVEAQVFTLTAHEDYMDDTVYTITVKRENPPIYLGDLQVLFRLEDGEVISQECRLGAFGESLIVYGADIPNDARTVVVRAKVLEESTLSYRYEAEGTEERPLTAEGTADGDGYETVYISFPEMVKSGTVIISTAKEGRRPVSYTLTLNRLMAQLRLVTVILEPLTEAVEGWTDRGVPEAFNPYVVSYTGDVINEVQDLWIGAKLPASEAAHTLEWEVSPASAVMEADNRDGLEGKRLRLKEPKYVVTVRAKSALPEILSDTVYTVTVTRAKDQLRLRSLSLEPAAGGGWTEGKAPTVFDPMTTSYTGEATTQTGSVWIGAELAASEDGHELVWDLSPSDGSLTAEEGKPGRRLVLKQSQYTVTIRAKSGLPGVLDDTVYTVMISRRRNAVRLSGLVLQPAAGGGWRTGNAPAVFNPEELSYTGEVTTQTGSIWIGAELTAAEGPHSLEWKVDSGGRLADEERGGKPGKRLDLPESRYRVTITVKSGIPAIMDDTVYTLNLSRYREPLLLSDLSLTPAMEDGTAGSWTAEPAVFNADQRSYTGEVSTATGSIWISAELPASGDGHELRWLVDPPVSWEKEIREGTVEKRLLPLKQQAKYTVMITTRSGLPDIMEDVTYTLNLSRYREPLRLTGLSLSPIAEDGTAGSWTVEPAVFDPDQRSYTGEMGTATGSVWIRAELSTAGGHSLEWSVSPDTGWKESTGDGKGKRLALTAPEYTVRITTRSALPSVMEDVTYTLTLKRKTEPLRLTDLHLEPAAGGSWTSGNAPAVFAPGQLSYTGELSTQTGSIWIGAELPTIGGAHTLEWSIDPPTAQADLADETLNNKPGKRLTLNRPQYTVMVTAKSALPNIMADTVYTLTLSRQTADIRLKSLTLEPRTGMVPSTWTPGKGPAAFDPANLNYTGEVINTANRLWVKAALVDGSPAGSGLTYSINPSANRIPDGDGWYIDLAQPQYLITITAGNTTYPLLYNATSYTVMISREGLYTVETPADGEVRVRAAASIAALDRPSSVENAKSGTTLYIRATAGLGYNLGAVTVTETGDDGVPAIKSLSGDFSNYVSYTMPSKNVSFDAGYIPIEAVPKVAYVSEEGWNDEGYGEDYTVGIETRHTATSWGTASRDLQAVINSWTGPGGNFEEIWVNGTVTPKTPANTVVGGYTVSSGDPKDLAFVIPPGLKIYGGFTGIEAKGNGPGQFPDRISAGYDRRDKNGEDWRLRTVLSGAVTSATNTYHVVIMADIPESNPVILDGLTVSDGMGADSQGSIDIKGYSINRRAGAGLYLVNASPVLQDVRIQENKATAGGSGIAAGGGGGIYNLASGSGKVSNPRLTRVLIYNNSVVGNGGGGGMYNGAQNAGRCKPVLDDVTIELNQTSGSGGGLYHVAESGAETKPEIKNSLLTRNSASGGAGAYNGDYADPTFTRVVIRGNSAGNAGGGVYNDGSNSHPVYENVTIAGNSAASYGGAVLNDGYYTVMTNVTISGNIAIDSTGGGIHNRRGGLILTNVLLENNFAANNFGGALYTINDGNNAELRSVVIITNGIIRGNKANRGGGIYNYYSNTGGGSSVINHLALTNVLIAENTANSYGGGIFNNNNNASSGKGITVLMNNVTIAGNDSESRGGISNPNNSTIKVTANNSIIWGNTSKLTPLSPDNIYDLGGKIVYNHSLAQGLTLDGSGASTNYKSSDGNYAPDNFTNPFTGNGVYTLGTGASSGSPPVSLINGGNNSIYPASAADLLDGALDVPGFFNQSTFSDLITEVVFSSGGIGKDAAAAQGDLYHTVTVTGEIGLNMIVTVNDTNTGPAGNTRIQDSVIDVGAYENE
jgi:hypothetical protein